MINRMFVAMFAAMAVAGIARAGDAPAPPRQLVPTGTPAPDEPSARLDWSCAPPACAPPACAPPVDAWYSPPRGGCGQPSCFWVRGEALLWWTKDSNLPALITTGVPGATTLPGVLGQPGTTVVYGGAGVDERLRAGGRFTAGFWLNDSRTLGLEGSYFFLANRSVTFDGFSGGTPGSPIIARPFFDVIAGIPNAQLVAFPGIVSGEIHVSASSRLQGADLNLLCNRPAPPVCVPQCPAVCADPCAPPAAVPQVVNFDPYYGRGYRVTLLGGVRYLQLDESLGVVERSRVSPALPAGSPLYGGSTITISDQFDTHNYFYGVQIGARAELCWGPVFVDVLGKFALGTTHQVVDIHGSTVITSPAGTTIATPAGFLASGSNSGRYTRDRFSFAPEVGVNVGYQLTSHCRASVGYTFMYWSSVVRPGDQIDTGLSGTQIVTDGRYSPSNSPARPATQFRTTDFWVQGINLGLEFRY